MTRALRMALVLTAAAVAACGGDKTTEKKETPAAGAAAPATSAKPSAALSALLPARNEVAGWAVSREARGFTADNLWELIDGAADGFVNYGVQDVATADYTQAGSGYQAVIELYRMKDPLNAFGKYSEERNPDYQFLQVGNEGYSGGTSLNFWTGPYYVKLTAFEEKDPIKQELLKLAQAVAAKVKDAGAEPREVTYFPKENQLPHSTVFIPKDVLAQSYLANGFEAKYKGVARKEAKIVFIPTDSPAAAKASLAKYRDAVVKGGNAVKDIASPGEGFAGKDSFYGNLAAARSGRHIAVALGFATGEACQKQVADVLKAAK